MLFAMSVLRRLRYELYDRQLPPIGLALFRIVYSLVLLCEVGQLFHLRHLIFDPVPYLQLPDASYTPALAFWLVVVVCLLLGWQTRAAAWANYAFTLYTFAAFHQFEYHIDFIYAGVNLLLPFLPVSECLSVDSWRMGKTPCRVSVFNYHAPLIVGVALMYFDSTAYKLGSPMWLDGLGLWRPASYPHTSWLFDPSWLLDQKYLVMGMSYLVVAFEATFPLLLFLPAFRGPIFVLGVAFHLGIAVMFPIPWFGLAMAALYLLLLPYQAYERLERVFGIQSSEDMERERWNLRIILCLTIGIVILQPIYTAQTPFAGSVANALGLDAARRRVVAVGRTLAPIARAVGCGAHAVFVDSHFDDYDHAVTVEMVDNQTNPGPIVPETGMTNRRYTGRAWAFWTFRACAPSISPEMLRSGIKRFTAFHMAQSGREEARYRVLARHYDVAESWEPGFYGRQIAKPWIAVGEVRWEKSEFIAEVIDVEAVQ